jgi:hypothetical protein
MGYVPRTSPGVEVGLGFRALFFVPLDLSIQVHPFAKPADPYPLFRALLGIKVGIGAF